MDDIDNIIDEAEDNIEDADDLQEGQLESFDATTYSSQKEKSDIYNWFWKVVRLGKLSEDDLDSLKVAKVGYLESREIGEATITMREALNLANLGEIFHHRKFGAYFKTRAMITAATSMSKKGWFMDLSISQKKVRERARGSSPEGAEKWRIFNRKKNNHAEE